MVTAIVTLKVDRQRVNDIALRLSELNGITEVYSVSGRYDLIALIRTKDTETLSDIVTGSMLKIEGIVDSETLLAFRVHSKHDLDSMFSIGVES
jgi:DNA-binding Lrp family transcriptional regulator